MHIKTSDLIDVRQMVGICNVPKLAMYALMVSVLTGASEELSDKGGGEVLDPHEISDRTKRKGSKDAYHVRDCGVESIYNDTSLK